MSRDWRSRVGVLHHWSRPASPSCGFRSAPSAGTCTPAFLFRRILSLLGGSGQVLGALLKVGCCCALQIVVLHAGEMAEHLLLHSPAAAACPFPKMSPSPESPVHKEGIMQRYTGTYSRTLASRAEFKCTRSAICA